MPRAILILKRHHTSMLNIVFALIVVAWVACQIFLPATEQPPLLTQALQACFGVWLTNLAYEQRDKEDRMESRLDDLESTDVGGRLDELEDTAKHFHGPAKLIEILERELAANQGALQLMKEAVIAKEVAHVPILPETFIAMAQLERQIKLLALDIEERRRLASEDLSEQMEPPEKLESP